MSLPFKPHIAKLPVYKPPSVPDGVERVIDLSSNENPLGPSPKAMTALRAAVGTVNRYPDASGAALKAALADKWGLSPAHIALGNGADEWVLLLCLSLGLAPLLVKEIFRISGELRQRGMTILLVEQNARAALDLADRAYVMESGRVVLEGLAAELACDERVQTAYLGKRN